MNGGGLAYDEFGHRDAMAVAEFVQLSLESINSNMTELFRREQNPGALGSPFRTSISRYGIMGNNKQSAHRFSPSAPRSHCRMPCGFGLVQDLSIQESILTGEDAGEVLTVQARSGHRCRRDHRKLMKQPCWR